MLFRDRFDAGRALAQHLLEFGGRDDVTVLALPRGGVPVAFEVARLLHLPLDVFVVRKLGVPGQEELAMGALASGGISVLDRRLTAEFSVSETVLQALIARERQELRRREGVFREGRPPLDLRGRTVILVDDGLATGASMHVAVIALRKRGPARIVVAVPVAAASTCAQFRSEVDQVVCAATPEPFLAVGQWYQDFAQTTDDEVHDLLRRAAQWQPASAA